MASSSYSEDLTCCVCLSLFTEPVTLLCGHSFCRECITTFLSSQQCCPQCRSEVYMEKTPLTTNHALKSVAERTKEIERIKKESGTDSQVNEWLCSEHEEKLKLFCVTDQQFVCLICRDGEKHEGHKFKPVKEAAESLKKGFQVFLQTVSAEISAAEKRAKTQNEEITKTKEKSQKLMSQISRQFQEMHKFLSKREAEIKNELKLKENEEVEKMNKSANKIKRVLSSNKKIEEKVKSALEITNSERFLKMYTKENSVVKTKTYFQQKAEKLPVINSCLSMGVYESHLQFFVWKEMLQVIQPKPEQLKLQFDSTDSRSASSSKGTMASSSYSEDLTCSVCLSLFTEPVTLLCGHSFCRECITTSLSSQQCCPQCRSEVYMEKTPLTTNHALKSVAERTKEIERIKKESGTDSLVNEWLCPEHEEKLKLFCVTDQQFVCLICRDGEKHEGHKFKPVKEAAESLKKEFQAFLQTVSAEISAAEKRAKTQNEEITKTKEKSQKLMSQISSQFQEMHKFLSKREAEIKNELKLKENEEVEKMNKSANEIEIVLSDNKKVEEKVKSALEITNSERFLRMYTEGDSVLKTKSSIQEKAQKLPVINSCLSMGVYESHLQFFVWKEMLQVIKSKPEQLSLSSKSPDGIVSNDGRSFRSACQQCKTYQTYPSYSKNIYFYGFQMQGVYNGPPIQYNTQPSAAFSKDQFTTGQHYWEVDVGLMNSWQLGLQNNLMRYNGRRYTISTNKVKKNTKFKGNIKKLGIYLNCFTKELSFYDADNMKLIETITYQLSEPVAAYFHIENTEDQFPLTVCWY
ncbi:Nuclear factor 7, ovary [Oryzias melastigma]|uniref:Nuclear factor 7, ovary n=1 Tax=Oryzias melastigma TaxID=30732 RepID=A0A834CB00_ORYME|nr:Nuclear factor 7, ovary [Oryzias melastigma]